MAQNNSNDPGFIAGQVASTGLCYMMCEEVPGYAEVASGAVAKGHEVYWYFQSLKKPAIPGYSGDVLNTSARVLLSSFDMVIDRLYAETFSNKCFNGSIFKKVTIVLLQNHGTGSMAKPVWSIELINAKITTYQDNVQKDLTDGIVAAHQQRQDLSQNSYNASAASIQAAGDPSRGTNMINALKLSWVAEQYNWIFYKIGIDGSSQGQDATSFNVLTNSSS